VDVRVDILGPVRLFVEGAEVSIRRSQVERALALLVAFAPQPVSHDQLIEHLWAESLPSNPRASLRVALSRVRTTLGDASDCLRAESTGYVLDAASDCSEYQALLQRASKSADADAVALLKQAGELWADSLPAFAEATLLEPLNARLRGLRQRSLVDHSECLYRLGRYDEAADVALDAHHADPSDERLSIAAAQSLAATGRKSTAIQLMTATRDALRNEMGLSPSDQFQSAEAAIVQMQSGPASVDSPAVAPAVGMPVVGRHDERVSLADAGNGLHVVLAEPGAGKSTLLSHVMADMADRGRTVLATQASQTPTRAMEPLASLLTTIAQAVPVDDHSDALRSALSRLAPDFVEGPVSQPASREGLLALAREAIQDFAAMTSDVVVVIDDAQWLDRSSVHVINALIDTTALCIVVGSRLSIPPGIEFLLDEQRHTATIRLEPLTQADIEQLVAQYLPSLPQEATIESLLSQSGGNALFLSLLADLMAEGGLADGALPSNVLLTVQQRLANLPMHSQRTLEIASVFTDSFPLAVLADLAPTAEADVAAAVADGLMVKADTPKTFRFAHSLVAESAYQLLPHGSRLELHDEVGRLLEAWGATAAEYSLHCGEAAELDPTRAARSHLFAAQEFAVAFDWETAFLHAQRGLGYHHDYQLAPSTMTADLHVIVGKALRSQGNPEGDPSLIDGVRLALEHEHLDTVVDGLLALCDHGRMSTPTGPEIYDLLKQALTAGLTVSQRAQLLACEGSLLAISIHQERGRQAHSRAFEMVEPGSDLAAKQAVLIRTHLGFPHPADFEMRVRATESLQQIAGNDPDLLWEVAFLSFGSAMVQGDEATAKRCLEEMRELTPRIRMRQRNYGLRFSEAAWARYGNDLDLAERLLAEAMEIGQESFDDGWTLVIYAAIMSSIRQAQGRLHELLPLADEWMRLDPEWPTWHVIAAACAAETGDHDRAQHELDWLKRDDFGCLIPDSSWGAMFSFLTQPVAFLGDRQSAATLLEMVEPYAGLNLWNGACIHGSADDAIATFRRVADGG